MRSRPSARDTRLVTSLTDWFRAAARPLPWRTTPRDPYRSLVSEAMLQQTQVSRVLEKFEPFLKRFPTVVTLASAPDPDVLAAWSGLGYYRRARNLHAAAKAIVAEHDAHIPQSLDDLLSLPGVGRYTAGAIASIVFNQPAPIVDGNVRRVLLRIEGKDLDEKTADAWAWHRAEELVTIATDPAAFNEGLMELGALICTPASPQCPHCPLRADCIARRKGLQSVIPRPKKRAATSEVHHAVVVVRDKASRLLLERRPDRGMWAGMWQAPTLEGDSIPDQSAVMRAAGVRSMAFRESFMHQTTHRKVHFHVWEAVSSTKPTNGRLWLDAAEVADLALANPHRRILLGHDSVKRGKRGLEQAEPSAMLFPLSPGPARKTARSRGALPRE